MKYKLTDEKIKHWGRTLYRIQALKDFGDVKAGDLGGYVEGDVKAGDLGGYVESERNLSQEGNCWVAGNARVYDDALISGNAKVLDNARVYGNAKVFDNAWVYDDAEIKNGSIW